MVFFPQVEHYRSWQEWGRKLVAKLDEPNVTRPVQLPSYSYNRLPSASQDGLVVLLLNSEIGEVPVFSAGGVWRYFDGTEVAPALTEVDIPATAFELTPLAPEIIASAPGPDTIADLALWLDMSDASTLWADTAATTQATSTVARVDDKSGNNNHAAQGISSSYRPITGTRTINSLNVLDFDGSDDYFTLTSAIGYTNGYTAFIVAEGDDFSGTNEKVLISGDTGANFELRVETSPSSYPQIIKRNTGIYAQLASWPVSTPGIISARSHTSGNALERDGVGTSNATVTSYTGDVNLIGRQGNPADYWDGKIAEIIVYDVVLTVAQVNIVLNYLSAKWGITATPVT